MVYILLGTGFEEAEALVPADLLHRAGQPVTLLGVDGDTVTGSHGIAVRADLPVEAAALAPGDTVVLPGGLRGVASLEGSAGAMALIRGAAARTDVRLAAICAAPAMLARARLLPPGTRAVCYPGMEGDLTAAGVVPAPDCPAVTDGRFLTGRAAGAAFDFALALVEALAGPAEAERVRTAVRYGG